MTRLSPAWHVRVRQSLLGFALAIPLLLAIVTAPPFSADPSAQAPARMLGPAFPIMAGAVGVVPTRSGSTISIDTPWTCGDTVASTFALSNPDGSGRYRTVSRDLGLLSQSLTVTGFSGGAPSSFLHEESIGALSNSTSITMLDDNVDGSFEAVRLSGFRNVTLSLVYNGDSVSFPWSQASAIGFNTSTCAGSVPQAWVPLADTNGDGTGDSVVFDLDGNGVADGDLFASVSMGAMAVPAMGPVARFALMVLMALIGTWFLSRRPENTSGTPA